METSREHFGLDRSAISSLRHRRVRLARVAHLLADGHHRVERVHRALHDDRELLPAHVPELLVAHLRPSRGRGRATLPPVMPAGWASSCEMANISVDLPQPDSPTTARNSPLSRSRSTLSTATTGLGVRGVGHREVADLEQPAGRRPASTSRSWPADAALRGPPASFSRRRGSGRHRRAPVADRRNEPPACEQAPHRPQRRVGDLVEGVVQEGERPAEQRDADARHDRPERHARAERLVVLRPVEHRAPALGVGVAEPDELQAGRGQHGEHGGARKVATMSEVIVGRISAAMM